MIRGVIQAAAVIKDGLYENLTYSAWRKVVAVKTTGTHNLHRIFQHGVDFFIMLSSAAGVIGNRGQSNYNAGNCFQDALAHHRTANGMRSVSLDLGPVLGAGMVAGDQNMWDSLRAGGFIGIRREDFHFILERAITGFGVEDEPFPSQVVMGVGTGGLVRQNHVANPFWTRSSLFSYLNRVDLPLEYLESETMSRYGGADLKVLLMSAPDRNSAVNTLFPFFSGAIANILGRRVAEMDQESVLDDHGPDSLRMTEILDWITTATGVKLSNINKLPLRSICSQIIEKGDFSSQE
jgi:hypothetical protein